jgi:hypothetical protein
MTGKTVTTEHRSAKKLFWNRDDMSLPSGTVSQNAYSTNSLLQSRGNRNYRRLGRGDVGGDFLCVKHIYDEGVGKFSQIYFYEGAGRYIQTDQYAYKENVYDSDFPVVNPTDPDQLAALGASAISKLLPTSPRVNTAAMVGEIITGGLPSLGFIKQLQERCRIAKAAGSNYLEAQFGWLPLINDLKKLQNVINNSNEILKQYAANSGRRLHRKFEWPATSNTSEAWDTQYPVPQIGLTRNPYGGQGDLLTQYYSSHRIWFEGCFTYYVEPFDPDHLSFAQNAELYQYLYGYQLTPDVLWQLAPWSWAIDWFGNFGDVLKNFTELADGGLVLEYGYIMERKISRVNYYLTQPWGSSEDRFIVPDEVRNGSFNCYQSFETDLKRRQAVGAYNVNINWDGLSAFQLSIGAALAFARAH